MNLLPILTRELRSRARAGATYWARFAVGLLGLLMCVPETFLAGTFGLGWMSGWRVFNGIISAAFLLSCSACLLAADSISAERREGTLGLLFLTQLKSLDVLLGKLSSVGLTSICALVAFLPVLMIPVLAGGIAGSEAFRSGLALIATLAFALGAGLFASAGQHERARAVRMAVLIVAFLVLVPFGVCRALPAGGWTYLGIVSPLLPLVSARAAIYDATPLLYWASLGGVGAIAISLVVLAGLRLRQAACENGGEILVRQRPSPVEVAKEVGLYRWEPGKDEASPIEWLVYRQQGVSAALWAPAVVALAYSSLVLWAHQPFAPPGVAASWLLAWPLGIAGALLGGGMVAWVASRFLVGVRRTGDLELLLTTPVGAQSLVSDQWSALKRLFTRNVTLMQAGMFLPVLGMTASSPGSEWHAFHTFGALLSLAGTLLGTTALCWLALWFALKARTQAGAVVWSVGLAKGVPCLVSVTGWVICAFLAPPLARGFGPAANRYALVCWLPEFGILAFYGWLTQYARRRLAEELAGTESRPALLRFQPTLPLPAT